MNSADSIDISTVVASFDNNLTVDGRVVDVKIIRLEEEAETGVVTQKGLEYGLLLMFIITAIIAAYLSFK